MAYDTFTSAARVFAIENGRKKHPGAFVFFMFNAFPVRVLESPVIEIALITLNRLKNVAGA